MSLVGQILKSRYHVERELGSGGMGAVYLARDEQVGGRPVVVKVPHTHLLTDDFRARFAREIDQLIQLAHPHIIHVYDTGSHEGVPFLVVQYVGGGDLQQRMRSRERFTREEVLHWLEPIAGALDFIHRKGRVHRDVKPGNLLFDEDDNAFLSDFGIATVMTGAEATSGGELTQTGAFVGSPMYAPPEAIVRDLRPQYDQYSLALIAYEALTGSFPFQGDSGPQLMTAKLIREPTPLVGDPTGIDPAAAAAVMRALARDPEQRFESCTRFVEAFRGLVQEEAPVAAPTRETAPADPDPDETARAEVPPPEPPSAPHRTMISGRRAAGRRHRPVAGPRAARPAGSPWRGAVWVLAALGVLAVGSAAWLGRDRLAAAGSEVVASVEEPGAQEPAEAPAPDRPPAVWELRKPALPEAAPAAPSAAEASAPPEGSQPEAGPPPSPPGSEASAVAEAPEAAPAGAAPAHAPAPAGVPSAPPVTAHTTPVPKEIAGKGEPPSKATGPGATSEAAPAEPRIARLEPSSPEKAPAPRPGAQEAAGRTPAKPEAPAPKVRELHEERVATAATDVRALPSVHAERVEVLGAGERVPVTGEVAGGAWLRVRLPGPKTGFVPSARLALVKPTRPEPAPSEASVAPTAASRALVVAGSDASISSVEMVDARGWLPRPAPRKEADLGIRVGSREQWFRFETFTVKAWKDRSRIAPTGGFVQVLPLPASVDPSAQVELLDTSGRVLDRRPLPTSPSKDGRIWILHPRDGQRIEWRPGQGGILLEAQLGLPKGGVDANGDDISWTSDVDGALGKGGVKLVKLTPGHHRLTASAGGVPSRSIQVEVVRVP